jgi:3-deoxy-D-manno-octulosonic-acid transferase
MMALYSLALTLGLVLATPWWLLQMVTTERYREGLWERLGAVPRALRDAVRGRRVVWVHAVSVGEVLAATRLVAELEAALGAGWVVAVSTTTRTGQALARERFGAERVFYMPLDFAFAVRAYMRVLQPAALVLMESELWPRLLHEARRGSIPVVVANARVSDRSFARAMRFRTLWSRMLRGVTMFLAQSEEDARRLLAMGAIDVRAIGNLKYDVRAPKQSLAANVIREVAEGRPIIVAGSTVGNHKSDEESWLIAAWGGRSLNQEGAMLVLAPRHPERFNDVWKNVCEFPSAKLSELLRDPLTRPTGGFSISKPSKADVVLVDTVGDLASLYSIADISFIGGSLLKRGGHNPLEAAQFGVPILMGPSYENFREVVEQMLKSNAIAIVGGKPEGKSEPSISESQIAMRDSLEANLMRLLTLRQEARAMGERGRKVFESQQGATARAVEAILAVVRR